MNNVMKILFYILSICFIYNLSAQNKTVYIKIDSSINYYQDVLESDNKKLQLHFFKKYICSERSQYSVKFDENGKLNKLVKLSHSQENTREMSFYSIVSNNKEEILKISILEDEIIKTSNIEDIEWSSFESLLNQANDIYIITESSSSSLYYSLNKLLKEPPKL